MATFSYAPDKSPELEEKPNVTPLKFGDGYEQRIGEGINLIKGVWNLTFNNRSQADATAIRDFFRARVSPGTGMESFDWTPPDESTAIKVVCRSWKRTRVNAAYASVSATFEQVIE